MTDNVISYNEQTRRLSAIMFTDIAGFSRQMGHDEETTIRLLDINNQIITDVVKFHNGRIIDTIGDAFMIEFDSAVRAVKCALDAQERFRTYNKEIMNESEKVFIRIGIHLGDVLVRGTRILGDSVNIASRLVNLAEPGGICFSRFVFDQIRNKMGVNASLLGMKQLKNIVEPIEVYSINDEFFSVEKTSIGKVRTFTRAALRIFHNRQFLYGTLTLAVVFLQVFVFPHVTQSGRDTELAKYPSILVSGKTEELTDREFRITSEVEGDDMYRSMIKLLRNMNKNEEVVALARQYVNTNPNSVAPWLTLGFALEVDKQFEEAATAYQKVIEIDHGNIEAQLGLSRVYLVLKKFNECKVSLETALMLDPKRKELPNLFWKLGDRLAESQHYPEALPLYQKATNLMAKQK